MPRARDQPTRIDVQFPQISPSKGKGYNYRTMSLTVRATHTSLLTGRTLFVKRLAPEVTLAANQAFSLENLSVSNILPYPGVGGREKMGEQHKEPLSQNGTKGAQCKSLPHPLSLMTLLQQHKTVFANNVFNRESNTHKSPDGTHSFCKEVGTRSHTGS